MIHQVVCVCVYVGMLALILEYLRVNAMPQ